jgi:serine/threonine protein kinase
MFHASQQIGVYTLICKLGEGGFGEVWLAENRNHSPSEKVAIKLPRNDQIDLQAVKDEIFNWTLSGKHKNILPIIECETFGNQIAIISEFAPDGSLQDLLKRHGSYSVADAVEITIGILEGLSHLHKRKIIHRDLKPDNVLFQGEIPRLTDFGISRALPEGSQSEKIAGTINYMALECFDGKRTRQTDIWAVGAILYQLLTGELPFPQKTLEERIFAMIMKEPAPLPDSIPSGLQQILMKLLAKDAAERYQTANEAVSDMQSLFQEISAQNPDETIESVLIPFRKGDKWGFSNKYKKLIIEAKYDDVESFSEGLARVTLNGKKFYIDKNGTEYYEP